MELLIEPDRDVMNLVQYLLGLTAFIVGFALLILIEGSFKLKNILLVVKYALLIAYILIFLGYIFNSLPPFLSD